MLSLSLLLLFIYVCGYMCMYINTCLVFQFLGGGSAVFLILQLCKVPGFSALGCLVRVCLGEGLGFRVRVCLGVWCKQGLRFRAFGARGASMAAEFYKDK